MARLLYLSRISMLKSLRKSFQKTPVSHRLRFAVAFVVGVALYVFLDRIKDINSQVIELASQDISLNDIYYSVRSDYDSDLLGDKQVVLVNLGSKPLDSLRSTLAVLLERTWQFSPALMAVDVTFEEDKVPQSDRLLKASLNKYHPILAKAKMGVNVFKECCDVAYINLPDAENESIRHYYNYGVLDGQKVPSFASLIAQKKAGRAVDFNNPMFRLRYNCVENGYFDVFDTLNSGAHRHDELRYNFPAIEATDLLDTGKDQQLRLYLKGKIVIFAWMGSGFMNYEEDVSDRFKTPTDRALVNRSPIMPGAVIHAVAVEMMLNNYYYSEPTVFTQFLISIVLLVLAYLTIIVLGDWAAAAIDQRFKKKRWLMRFLLSAIVKWSLVFVWILLLIYGAGVLLMARGYYLEAGTLLLQFGLLLAAVSIGDEIIRTYRESKMKKQKD